MIKIMRLYYLMNSNLSFKLCRGFLIANQITLVGVDGGKYKSLLAGERHTFDHYIYSEDNLTNLIYDSDDRRSDYIIWYFVYVMDLVIRINFLKESGVALNRTAVDYALSAINDWIIYENDLDEECTTYQYQLKQMLKKCGLEIK